MIVTGYDIVMGLLVIIGTLGAGLCAGAEMGAYAINRVRLNLRAARRGDERDRAANLLKREVDQGPRLLAVLLIGYNLFSYIGALGLTTLLSGAGISETRILLLNVLVIGPILFVVADIMPKELFRAEADRLMYPLAGIFAGTRWLLTIAGVLPLVKAVARLAAALIPGEGEEAVVESARQRMAVLLKEGATHGAISQSQAALLDRAFGLRETLVADEMVPWSQVRTMSASWDAARALAMVRDNRLTRFPLVDARGQVMGLVEHLDVSLNPGKRPADLVKPIARLDGRLNVREALLKLGEHGSRLAIVTEKGRPIGVVTAKDLCEPLTGELKAW